MPDDKIDILVVDDLPEKMLAYRSILDELGENLVTARSGAEALRLVLQHDFAVILLDVNMPGMDGFEAASLIRQRRKSAHTPIIFLTAFTDEVRAAEGYAHGAVDYIPTPVVPTILRAKVRVFVELYRMARQVKQQAEERVALAAAEEATRRAGFLAEVSRALADSLDPLTTARTVARQSVPFLADIAGVTLHDEPGKPWRTEIAWTSPPDPEPKTYSITSSEAPLDVLRDAVDRVLAGGRTECLTELDLPYPVPPDEAPLGRVRSAVVVPLGARGRTLGVLTLAFSDSERRHGPDTFALAEDLASRAAIALDNARLYREVEDANRQKNEFLSMLAHELRNPLAPIRNAARVLDLKATDTKAVQWARDIIDRQLTHLVRLVDDLLDVSRITQGKIRLQIEPTDLTVAATQAVEASRPLIDASRHRIDVDIPQEGVWVEGDTARLTQVITNLLNNAAKYTPEGGRISLRVAVEGPNAVVRVKDTGMGIPPEMLSAIFDLFTQANRSLDRAQGGLGVGLTLVRRLVELQSGSVRAFSEGLDRGSEFEVRLPLCQRAMPSAAASAVESTLRTARRVVLVDDNVDCTLTLAELLKLVGHDVVTADNGITGVELVRQHRPDLAVFDIGLPGIDGFEAAKQIRSDPELNGTRLIAMSGYGRDEDRQAALDAGFERLLVKPVEFAEIRALLDEVQIATEVESIGQPKLPVVVA